jgi:hypothetical protein
MKTFKEITTEAVSSHNVEKEVKVGKDPKHQFRFTRTPRGVIGIEYGDKGNVVFLFGRESKQIIDLLQGKG